MEHLGVREGQLLPHMCKRAFLSLPLPTVVGLCLFGLPVQREGAGAMKENLLMVRINGVAVSENEPVLELEPGRLSVPVAVFRDVCVYHGSNILFSSSSF